LRQTRATRAEGEQIAKKESEQRQLLERSRGGNLEASVRKVLPKDEQIVVAVVSVYASLFGLYKIKSAFSKKPEVPVVAAPVATSSSSGTGKWGFEPPTLDTFDAWEKVPENWTKWESFLDSPKLDEWANSL